MKQSTTTTHLLVAAIVVVTAAAASASVTIQIHGLESSSNFKLHHDGGVTNNAMGNFKLSIEDIAGDAYGFCMELERGIEWGTFEYEQVEDLGDLSSSIGGLTDCQSGALQTLFGMLDGTWELRGYQRGDMQDLLVPVYMGNLGQTDAGALQLLVWEISHEYDGVSFDSISLTSGAYTYTNVKNSIVSRFGELKSELQAKHDCVPVPSPAAVLVGLCLVGHAVVKRPGRKRNIHTAEA